MGRALRLAVMGAPLGGGVNYPESITDDFASDSGLWLDGDLAAAAITVSGGKGIWTPTLGEITNGNSDLTAWTDDKPDLWLVVLGATGAITEVAPDGSAGTGAAKFTSTSTNDRPLLYGAGQTANSWNLLTVVISAYTSGQLHVGHSLADFAYITGQATHLIAGRPPNSNLYIYGVAAPTDLVVDTISARPITLSTMFRVQPIYYPSAISSKLWYLRACPLGITAFKDLNNWIATVVSPKINSSSANIVTLYRCVSGTQSVVSTSDITYSAGAALELIPAADFQTWTVKYDGATKINAASIIDFSPTGIWHAGLFTTHDASDTSIIGADDFAATRIEGAPPF